MRSPTLAVGPLCLALLSGCSFFEEFFETDPDAPPSDRTERPDPTETDPPTDPVPTVTGSTGATGDTGDSLSTTPPDAFALPDDIALAKVSVYQGVERPLWIDGAPAGGDVPVISDREALIRVFVEPDEGFVVRDLRVSLVVESPTGPVIRARTRRVTGPSIDAARNSTFEFTVPAAELSGPAELQVALTEADEALPGSGSPDRTTFDSALDLPGGLPIEAGRDIDIVVVPFRYQADESGREPDLSQPRLDDLRATLEAIWPVRNVNLTVAPAIDWDLAILRNGDGFGEALEEIEALRQNAAVPSSTYYYGMFDPADSFGSFCQGSCVTGLSYVPEATSAPQYRSSVGIGFTNSGTITSDTMAHEVGHALGRSHSPCGNPDGVDGSFPYADGSIGAWGYDREADALFDPANRFDMMSYCNPVWISDHNFDAIYERIRALSTSPFAPSRMVTALRVDGDDHVKSLGEARVFGSAAGMGARVVVELIDAEGQARGFRDGWRVRLSHLPGGVVLLDEALPTGWSARIP